MRTGGWRRWRRSDRVGQRAQRRGRPRELVLAVANTVALLVLVLATWSELPAVAVVLASVTLAATIVGQQRMRRHLERVTDLRRQAGTDELTGLPNRRQFAARLDGALVRGAAPASSRRRGLLMLDLDGFKQVNDTLGHASGDRLLQEVATRLSRRVRPEDVVARLGGDEFAVLIETAADEVDLSETASRLLDAVRRPISLGPAQVTVSGSIGIVPFTQGRSDLLLGDADLAMYEAKARGRNQAVIFEPALRHRVEQRVALQTDLREALRVGALTVWYQPVMDMSTGTWTGAEALSRWHHPVRGFVRPGEFIGVAEEIGLIGDIGRSVLSRTLPQVRDWKSWLPADHAFCVGVNVSPRELADPGFVERVLTGCARAGIPADALVLEITEGTLMAQDEHERVQLDELRRAGARIALDDFGTGYSSLSYLVHLPIDIIKLDRSFVSALGSGRREEAVIGASSKLARDLDLILVAEGVETQDQVHRLLDLGCHLGQGYHLARPMPADEFAAELAAANRVARPPQMSA